MFFKKVRILRSFGSYRFCYFFQAVLQVVSQIVLPKTQYCPFIFLVPRTDFFVSFFVSLYFGVPIRSVGLRHSAMVRASVPKTRIYKYGQFFLSENYVRFSYQLFVMLPVFVSLFPQLFSQKQLDFCVFATDGLHYLASLFL